MASNDMGLRTINDSGEDFVTNASTLAGAKKKWKANFRLNQNSELLSKVNLGTTGSNASVLKNEDGTIEMNIHETQGSNQFLPASTSNIPFPTNLGAAQTGHENKFLDEILDLNPHLDG